jgi:hypothetical protein
VFILARKELRQHAVVLAAACLCWFLLYGILWISVIKDGLTPSVLEAATRTLTFATPATSLLLGYRLVVMEYSGRTQLFVEALPGRRWEMAVTKYLFGLMTLWVLCAAVLVLGVVNTRQHEILDVRGVRVIAIRTAVYAGASFALFFAFGFLGRLRAALYIALYLLAFILEETTAFETSRFGPIALVRFDVYAYERDRIQRAPLLQTLGLWAGATALGFALAWINDGSLSERLARRASTREKAAIWALLCLGISGMILVDPKPAPPQDDSFGDLVERGKRASVAVFYGRHELKPRAARLTAELEQALVELKQEVGWSTLPSVRVIHASTLEANNFQQTDGAGVGLEANLGALPEKDFWIVYEVIHAAFAEVTGWRAGLEPHHWLLDGFSVMRAVGYEHADRQELWVAALVASRSVSVSPKAIQEWDTMMDQLGEQAANALAFSVVAVALRRYGRRRLAELVRHVLARPGRNDARAWLASSPFPAEFSAITGEDWERFVDAWRTELDHRRRAPQIARALEQIPIITGSATPRSSNGAVDIAIALRARSALLEPLECSVLHRRLAPYDTFVSPHSCTRMNFNWPAQRATSDAKLVMGYTRGDRVFLAIDCEEHATKVAMRVYRARIDLSTPR